MKITILTLFPEMFAGPFDHSIIKRAKEKGLVDISFVNIRDFGIGPHKMIDDTPYGGGVGMVMRVDVIHQAIEYAKSSVILNEAKNLQDPSAKPQDDKLKTKVVLMSASGAVFKQNVAKEFSKIDHLILICGHYEGIDDRINQYIDEEISIGDYVLTGGEIPAMIITDAVTRLLDGVISEGATDDESFSLTHEEQTLLEYPHYTKPQTYENQSVPEVLLNGNHKLIADWRNEKAVEKTKKVRPDLLKK